MTAAHHSRPFAWRWSALAASASVAAYLLLVVDWAPARPRTEAAPAAMIHGPAETDISQLFQKEKAMASESELPAQF